MQRAQVLSAATAAVADRGLNYGSPEDNFARIARLWNAHLVNRGLLSPSSPLTQADVALMMAQLKQARLTNDPTHADSWIDMAGYAACGGEVSGAGAVIEHDENAHPQLTIMDGIRAVQVEPETKFGFTVGEIVNTQFARPNSHPGIVTGFGDGGSVVVHYETFGTASYSPTELRHGP